MAGIRAEDEIIIFGFFLCPVWEGRYALGGVHNKVSVISVQFAVEHEIERRKGYDKSIYLKNSCPQEWEEISFTAFRKARSSGAFSGRFFIETTRMIYDDSDRLIIECSQEQFEKYRHEERHSRYLQEHEGRYLTIPMSDLKDRDQSDEGYEDTDIFVNEEQELRIWLYITYSLKIAGST